MRTQHLFLISFAVAIGIITYADLRYCKDMPWPPRLIAAGIVFMGLDAFSIVNERLANLMAFGLILGLVLDTLQGEDGKFVVGNCQHADTTSQTSAFNTL